MGRRENWNESEDLPEVHNEKLSGIRADRSYASCISSFNFSLIVSRV